ncbi:MAG: hypothetical protein K6F00_01410 [Lachnospiraceae bacterium]|nr:hypothetical protein [Lachnospiraceae bacterium]
MENTYRLKKKDKWLIVKRQLGRFTYIETDNKDEATELSEEKARIVRNMICSDSDSKEEDFNIVEC